jgi:hypothetical protein
LQHLVFLGDGVAEQAEQPVDLIVSGFDGRHLRERGEEATVVEVGGAGQTDETRAHGGNLRTEPAACQNGHGVPAFDQATRDLQQRLQLTGDRRGRHDDRRHRTPSQCGCSPGAVGQR